MLNSNICSIFDQEINVTNVLNCKVYSILFSFISYGLPSAMKLVYSGLFRSI